MLVYSELLNSWTPVFFLTAFYIVSVFFDNDWLITVFSNGIPNSTKCCLNSGLFQRLCFVRRVFVPQLRNDGVSVLAVAWSSIPTVSWEALCCMSCSFEYELQNARTRTWTGDTRIFSPKCRCVKSTQDKTSTSLCLDLAYFMPKIATCSKGCLGWTKFGLDNFY